MTVDLPHYQHHRHLQSCWQKNLGLEALILKTVMKVGVACHPLCPQKRNISPRRCLNPLRFLIFDSEIADEPVSHEKSHFPLTKHSATSGWNNKLSTDISRNFCKGVGENALSPYLTTITKLLPSCLLLKKHSFMTQHSIPLTKCKAELAAQYAFKTYDAYAFMAN